MKTWTMERFLKGTLIYEKAFAFVKEYWSRGRPLKGNIFIGNLSKG